MKKQPNVLLYYGKNIVILQNRGDFMGLYLKNQIRGARFENKTFSKIKRLLNTNVYTNIGIKTSISTHEIDGVFVNEHGIFCVECKSSINCLYTEGGLFDKSWSCINSMRHGVNMFLNPVNQNYGHIKQLNKLFPNTPIYNIVITEYDAHVFYNNQLYDSPINLIKEKGIYITNDIPSLINTIFQMPNVLDNSQIQPIQEKLKSLEMHGLNFVKFKLSFLL